MNRPEPRDLGVPEQPDPDRHRQRHAQRRAERPRAPRRLQRPVQLARVHAQQLLQGDGAQLHHANHLRGHPVQQRPDQGVRAAEPGQDHEHLLRVHGAVHGARPLRHHRRRHEVGQRRGRPPGRRVLEQRERGGVGARHRAPGGDRGGPQSRQHEQTLRPRRSPVPGAHPAPAALRAEGLRGRGRVESVQGCRRVSDASVDLCRGRHYSARDAIHQREHQEQQLAVQVGYEKESSGVLASCFFLV